MSRKPPGCQQPQQVLFQRGVPGILLARFLSPIARLALLAFLMGGCAGFPRDQNGTTARIRESGILSVGASSSDTAPTALEEREEQLVDRVAAQLGARAVWRRGNTHELLEALEEQKLALVAATVPCDSPFAERVAMSQPYRLDEPRHQEYCLAVAPGENELLLLVDHIIADMKEPR
jgi:hypothetical protein